MPTRDILFAMMSHPAPTSSGAVEKAVGLAAGLGAHISGLALELHMRSPVGFYADPMNVGGIIATENRKSAENARDLVAAFDDGAGRRGVMHDQFTEQCAAVEAPQVLIDHARLRDFSVFPFNASDQVQRSLIEDLIFESGRPVLLLPEGATRELSTSFDNVCVTWDHSRPAARAVADALALLQTAKHVYVVTVVDEKRLGRPRSGVELCKHLARHGVEVTFDEVKAGGRPIGDVLEAHVTQRNIDLLVMGAYGHSRMREFVLGGATRSVLTRPCTWTLLSH